MQQFQVPQFIDVEDRVFGPLTIKQFIYLLGGGSIDLVLWFFGLPWYIYLPLAGIIGGFFVALAFMKYNGQPLVTILNNMAKHYYESRFYVWKRSEKKDTVAPTAEIGALHEPYMPKLTQSKLKDLSWSLDINNKVQR